MPPPRFRVGKDSEGIYVWDREFQPDSPRICLLWLVKSEAFEVFEMRLVKAYTKPINDERIAQSHISHYLNWKQNNTNLALEQFQSEISALEEKIKPRLEKELARQEERKARHKRFLEKNNLPETETKKLYEPKKLRVTHCWNCKQHLDNTLDVECVACGWIICDCGACGCGRSQNP